MGLRQGINIIVFLVVAWAILEAAKHHQAGAHQADSIRADLEAADGLDTLVDLEVQVDGKRRTALTFEGS